MSEGMDAEFMLVKASPGLGKTRAALKAIAESRGNKTLVMLVPTLDKAEEGLATYDALKQDGSLPTMVFRGRGAPDVNAQGAPMCPRNEIAKQIAEAELSVEVILCKQCPHRQVCGYKRQQKAMRERPKQFIIAAHEYLFLGDVFPSIGLLVIDEAVTLKAAISYEFTPDRITSCFPWKLLEKDSSAADVQQTLMKIEAIFSQQDTDYLAALRTAKIKLQDIKQAHDFLEQQRVNFVSGIDGRMDDADISEKLLAMTRHETKKIICLLKQIQLEWSSGRANFNSIIIDPQAYAKDGSGNAERQRRVFVYSLRTPILAEDVPTLLMDGTADVELNERLFGCPINVKTFTAERTATTIQVTGKSFSAQSLTGKMSNGRPLRPDEAQTLRNDVAAYINSLPHESILVVCTKKVEELLKLLFAQHVRATHFGAVRGMNAYEDYEAVVVIGGEHPNVEDIARAYAASDSEPFFSMDGMEYKPETSAFKATRGLRMRGEAVHPIAVRVHPHSVAQAVLEQVREAEIIQAIDRVRSLRHQRHIYILNEVVADITVDAVIPWRIWKSGGSRLEQAIAKGDVVPVSPAEMTRLFPTLWATQKAAEHDIQRTPKPQIDILFGKWGFIEVRYKRMENSGKPYAAWVRGENRRSILESVVGPVAEFEDDCRRHS